MQIMINNVEWLPEAKQFALGQKILQAMYVENIKVDDVQVVFVDESAGGLE